MNKWILIGLAAVALAIVVGGGIWVANKNKSPQPVPEVTTSEVPVNPGVTETEVAKTTPKTEEATTGKEVEFTVDGSNFKYAPATLKVKKGDTVRILFKNVGGFHDLVIDEFEVKTNQIGDGDEEEVEFIASKAGTFEYYCSVGNHRKMGMVGKLIVE